MKSTERSDTQKNINVQKLVEKVTLNVIDELKITNRIYFDC